MKGRRGGKYNDVDVDLMPVMLADPSRDLNRGDPKVSLSYNTMLMTRNGSVMTKDNIKDLREHHGYCVSCQGEPIKLFEIKKSKINPLFRGKESIDVAHESYNGICLKCNPAMDPHRIMRRNTIQGNSREGSMSSLESKGARSRSMSRSRSTSPEPIYEETERDTLDPEVPPGPPLQSLQHKKTIERSPRPLPKGPRDSQSGRKRNANVPSAPGTPSTPITPSTSLSDSLTPQEDLFCDLLAKKASDQDDLFGSPASPRSKESGVSPEESVGRSESCSLGSHLQSNKVPIIKSQLDDFSMPDFSEGGTSFKSHRKKGKKKEEIKKKEGSKKKSLGEIKEGKTKSSFETADGNDMFGDFPDSGFSFPVHDSSISRRESTDQGLSSKKPPSGARSHAFKGQAFGETSFFVESSQLTSNKFSPFDGHESRQMDPFSSSNSLATWEVDGQFDDDEYDEKDECDEMSWPAPPSAATISGDSIDTLKGASIVDESDASSFLAPPSESSWADRKRYALERKDPSELSLNLQDAVLRISRSEDLQGSMTPSQLIQADDLLMSGIKPEAAAYAAAKESSVEMDDMSALLEDVAAAGNSEILIDMLVGTIREHKHSVEVQELCLKHIWDHSKFNEAHKTNIMDSGLAQEVIRAMRTHRKARKIQEYGCGCIWSLSVNQVNRVILCRADAVKLIFRALEEFIDDEITLETVFGALRTLSPEKEVRDAIVPLLGSRRVCRAMSLHRSSTAIQRDGCAFLSNIAVDTELQMVSVVSPKEIEAVVRALGDHLRNESVVSSACFALKNYTYEEKNLRNLRRFDDVSSLLDDAAKYSTKAEIRVDAEEINERLRLLCEEDDALEEIAYSSLLDAMDNPKITVDQAVENFIDVLKQYPWSEKLTCYSIASLLSLSRQSQEYLTRITQFDVLKVLVHVLHKSDSAAIQERGCETLKFLAQQGNRPRTMICDVDGSSVLISALRKHHGNDNIKTVVVGALEELSKDPRCAQLINKELSIATQQQHDGAAGRAIASTTDSLTFSASSLSMLNSLSSLHSS